MYAHLLFVFSLADSTLKFGISFPYPLLVKFIFLPDRRKVFILMGKQKVFSTLFIFYRIPVQCEYFHTPAHKRKWRFSWIFFNHWMFLQYGFLDVYLHIPYIYKDHLQHVLFCVSGGFAIFYTLIVFFSTVDFFMPSMRAGPKEYFRTCFTYICCLSCVTSFVSKELK